MPIFKRLFYASRQRDTERWYRPRAAALRLLSLAQHGLALAILLSLGVLVLAGRWLPGPTEALYFSCLLAGLFGLGFWSGRAAGRRFPVLVIDDARRQLRWEGAPAGTREVAYPDVRRVIMYPNLPLVAGAVAWDGEPNGWVVSVVDDQEETTVAAVFREAERQLGMEMASQMAQRCQCVLDIRVDPSTITDTFDSLDDAPIGRHNA